MASGKSGGGGRGPADDEGRKLLFGLPTESEDSEAEPRSPSRRPAGAPASASAPPVSGDDPGPRSAADGSPADLAAAIRSVAAGQRRLEATLAEATVALSEAREIGSGFAALKQAVERASEFANNVKAANEAHLQAAGAQIGGLKEGRADIEKLVAALKLREEGFAKHREAMDKGIGALRTLWKTVDDRSRKLDDRSVALETAARTLADNYKDWTDGSEALRKEMESLSEALLQGGARMAESVAKNAEAQLKISVKTLGNVAEFKEANDGFMERFDAGGEALLGAIRREWTATRRWTVPSLTAALVVVALSFPVLGAWSQSEFGMFGAYDDTGGLKQAVWDRQGELIEECIEASRDRGRPVGCRLRIDARGYGAAPARLPARLPPLPSGD